MRLEFKGDGKGFSVPVVTTKKQGYSRTGVAFQNSSSYGLFQVPSGLESLWIKFDVKQIAKGTVHTPLMRFQTGTGASTFWIENPNSTADYFVINGAREDNGEELKNENINTILIHIPSCTNQCNVQVWVNGVACRPRPARCASGSDFCLSSTSNSVWFSNIIVSDEMIGFGDVAGKWDSSDKNTKSCYLTEEELERYENIIEDLTMEDVQMASSLIDGYLGRSFAPTEYRDRVMLSKKRRGKLKHSPVIDVSKIEAVQSSMFGRSKLEIPLDDVELDPERDGYFTYIGSLGLNGMIFGSLPKTLEITYQSGFKNYPDRLKDACGMLACNIRQAKSFNGAKQLTSLDFQILMTDDSFFTSDIKMLLKGLDSDVQLF